MIPKIIHYCWFGKSNMPETFLEYIDGWKKCMPDYEIIRWDESNYDINACRYVKEAYEAKKWGFVSDFARIDILYRYGGIYLDTDVEVIKSYDDLLGLKGFMAIDARGLKGYEVQINSGSGMGFEKEHPILRLFLDEYLSRRFVGENGEYDLTPCSNTQTDILKKRLGLQNIDELQELNGITIFPSDYFSPYNDRNGKMRLTNNTHSIHHYAATWTEDVERYRAELRRDYCQKHRFIVAQFLSTFVAYKEYYGIVKMWPKIFKRLSRSMEEYRHKV